jgi:hypothetical protein
MTHKNYLINIKIYKHLIKIWKNNLSKKFNKNKYNYGITNKNIKFKYKH